MEKKIFWDNEQNEQKQGDKKGYKRIKKSLQSIAVKYFLALSIQYIFRVPTTQSWHKKKHLNGEKMPVSSQIYEKMILLVRPTG